MSDILSDVVKDNSIKLNLCHVYALACLITYYHIPTSIHKMLENVKERKLAISQLLNLKQPIIFVVFRVI